MSNKQAIKDDCGGKSTFKNAFEQNKQPSAGEQRVLMTQNNE
jgi:hypothetical protein